MSTHRTAQTARTRGQVQVEALNNRSGRRSADIQGTRSAELTIM